MKPDPAVIESLIERMTNAAEQEPHFTADELLSAAVTLSKRIGQSCVALSTTKPATQKVISDAFARLTLEFTPTNGRKQ